MKHRFIRGAVGLAGASLVAGVVTTLPVSAKTNLITSCGQVIKTGTVWVLANDLTCPFSTSSTYMLTAGIVIKKSDVIVNLNGHSITGEDTTNNTGNEQVGVLFANVKNVTLYDGSTSASTISAFDAGVAVLGGSLDTVNGLTVENNIAHVLLTGGATGTCSNPSTTGNPCYPAGYGDPSGNPCNYGDGIIADNSNSDLIENNVASGNGPFSGIALVDSSSNNTVTGNMAENQTVPNILVSGTPGAGLSGPCGPFGANIVGRGRAHQDIGLRIEGPGASHNTLSNNTSAGNELEGISVHSHVCSTSPSFGGPPTTPANEFNVIENNIVTGNGVGLSMPGESPNGSGISLLQEGPTGIVCPGDNETITGNTVTGNAWDGVFLPGRNSNFNTVSNNTLSNNANDGVEFFGGGSVGTTVLNGANNDTVTGNTIENNSHDGVELDRGSYSVSNNQTVIAPGASSNSITGNTVINANGHDGVELDALCLLVNSTTDATTAVTCAAPPSGFSEVVVAGGSAQNNAVSTNSASSNGHDGIQDDGPLMFGGAASPSGASGNTFNGNTASGSPTFDAEDDNTLCDSNSWGTTTADTFGTVSQSCIH